MTSASRLLHGFFGHVERFLYQTRPTPPKARKGVGNESASSASSSSSSSSLPHSNSRIYFEYLNRQALRRNVGNLKRADLLNLNIFYINMTMLRQTARIMRRDVADVMFKGMRQQGDLSFKRTMQLHRSLNANSARSPSGTILNSIKRPKLPRPPVHQQEPIFDVGLQSSKRSFHSGGMGFENFLTNVNSPLALRASADEVEDLLFHQKANLRRSHCIVPSTKSKSQEDNMLRYNLQKPATVYNFDKFHNSFPSLTESVSSFAMISKKSGEVEDDDDAQTYMQSEDGFEESSRYSDYFRSEEIEVETLLRIPLMNAFFFNDPSVIEPQHNSHSLTERGLMVWESLLDLPGFDDTLRYRVLAIEHAFDQEPLLSYRPVDWGRRVFVRNAENGQSRKVFALVPFSGCTAEEVREMLSISLSERNAEWFSQFVYTKTSNGPSPNLVYSNEDDGIIHCCVNDLRDQIEQYDSDDEMIHLSDSDSNISVMSRSVVLSDLSAQSLPLQQVPSESTEHHSSQSFIFPIINEDGNVGHQTSSL